MPYNHARLGLLQDMEETVKAYENRISRKNNCGMKRLELYNMVGKIESITPLLLTGIGFCITAPLISGTKCDKSMKKSVYVIATALLSHTSHTFWNSLQGETNARKKIISPYIAIHILIAQNKIIDWWNGK